MKFFRVFLVLASLTLTSHLLASDSSQDILAQKSTETQSEFIKLFFANDAYSFVKPAPNDYVQLQQDYVAVSFQNNCSSRAAIVARYMNLDGSWVTDGAWKLAAGEKGYLFDTRNTIFYFYGVNDAGQRWQGDHVVIVNGYRVPMMEVRMNIDRPGNYTINLNCR